MAKKLYEEADIQDIANALREKNKTSKKYLTSQMGKAIRELETKDQFSPDLSKDTVDENSLFKGITAHNKTGTPIIGAYPIEEVDNQADLIKLIKSILGGKIRADEADSTIILSDGILNIY